MVPLTTRDHRVPLWVPIEPPEGGLSKRSFAISDEVRSVSTMRLSRRLGRVEPGTLALVEDRLRVLLDL